MRESMRRADRFQRPWCARRAARACSSSRTAYNTLSSRTPRFARAAAASIAAFPTPAAKSGRTARRIAHSARSRARRISVAVSWQCQTARIPIQSGMEPPLAQCSSLAASAGVSASSAISAARRSASAARRGGTSTGGGRMGNADARDTDRAARGPRSAVERRRRAASQASRSRSGYRINPPTRTYGGPSPRARCLSSFRSEHPRFVATARAVRRVSSCTTKTSITTMMAQRCGSRRQKSKSNSERTRFSVRFQRPISASDFSIGSPRARSRPPRARFKSLGTCLIASFIWASVACVAARQSLKTWARFGVGEPSLFALLYTARIHLSTLGWAARRDF